MANSREGVVYGFDSTSSRRELPTRLSGEVGVAALFIDCQHYCCSRTSPLASVARRDFDNDYFFDRVDRLCRPNWARLVRACRVAGVDVVTTVISSLRRDAKDISRDYKVTGFRVFAKDPRDELVEELKPASDDELCLAKSSSSVFQSTQLDYVLRNMEVGTLLVAGVLTDQCVDHAVRDAADLGYRVVVVEDACATGSRARHEAAIGAFRGYTDAVLSTDEVVSRLLLPTSGGVVVTGFGPFGDVERNPTTEIVDMVRRLDIEGVACRVLGVSMEDVDRFIEEELEPLLEGCTSPISFLHLGVDERSSVFKLERCAVNECSFRIPDVNGCQPTGQEISRSPSGPEVLRSTVPVERIRTLEGLKDYTVEVSDDAGKFVCNYLYYRSLEACAKAGAGARSLFLHVPPEAVASIADGAMVVSSVCRHLLDTPDTSDTPDTPLDVIPLEVIALDDESIDDRRHAERVRESLSAHGFFLVRPPFPFEIVLDNARRHRSFFDLPPEEKAKLSLNESYCGWHGATERLDPENAACGDLREGIYFRRPCRRPHLLSGENQWPPPASLPGYRESVEGYMQQLLDLSARVVGIIALSLGLDRHHYDRYFDDAMLTLRPIRYLPEPSDEAAGRFACGAHTDYGFITFLYADPVDGLEIFHEGRWRAVGGAAVGEATLIVNIGDMGSAITGYQSTKHRVVNAEGRPRFSMPAFVDPNFDAKIPVAGGQDRDQGRDQPPIVSGMYLLDKYKQTHTHTHE